MSLLDDLREAGRALDIQFQPSSNEVQSVVGALVHFAEHGNAFLEAAAAGAEDVAKLLTPPAEEQAPAPAASPTADEGSSPAPQGDPTSAGTGLTDAELDAQLAQLEQLKASRQAAAETQRANEEGTSTESTDAPPASPASSSPLGRFLHRDS